MPEPTDVKSTQRFVGFVTYLSKFMPHLSELCEPLRRLTTKDAVFTWQSEQQNAFDTIKRLVTQQPILKYYDLSSEVTIQCDASQVGLGASLLQNNQPVTFASRALTDTEQRYAQIEKECLAIVFACERFDQYLLGRDVITVHSDHKPLETIFKKPLMTAPKRLQRMLLKLQKYSLRVEYKKGTQMYIADMLSRASLPLHVNTQLETKSEQIFWLSLENVNLTDGIKVSKPRIQQIKKHTQQDETLQTLKSVILMGWPETREEVPIVIREYWSYCDELTVQDGLLFKGELIIIPKTMRPEMLSKIHSSHLGIESCLRKAHDTLYWPHMSSEIRDFVSQCSVCNEYEQRQQKEPLMTHQIPEYPWSKLGVDIFTLHKEDYLITVDYYSDFWELDKLADTTSSAVIEFLKQHFARHGIPDEVVTDNGPQLSSAEFEYFARHWEFDHITTSPYNSQSNGKAESAVKIAKKLLKKSKKGGKDQWKSVLDWRNTPTEGMDSSPAQRLMSRRTQHSLPMAKALLRPQTVKEVPEKIKRKRQKAKQYYDESAKTLPELNIGQNIRMAPLPTDREKRWKFGKCVDQISPRSYIVDVNGRIYRRNRKYLRTTPEPFEIPTDVFDQHPSDLPERASEKNVTADRETINKGNSGQNGNGNNNKMSGGENTNCDNRANPSQNFVPGTPKRTRTRDVKRPKMFDDFVLIQ